jgi:membrane protein required for colicin V production
MSMIDAVVLVLLAVGVVRGYRTGFFKQAGAIAGVLIGFALGASLMEPVGSYLVRISGIEASVGPILGFVAVFAAAYLLVQIAAKMAEQVLGAAKLSVVNRAGGGAVGGLKAAMLLSIAFMGAAYVDLPPQSVRDGSLTYVPVASLMPVAWGYVADNSGVLDELSRRIEEAIPEEGADAPSESGETDPPESN